MTTFRTFNSAAKTLRKNPGFTLAAVLALGLGIGANSALFSVMTECCCAPFRFPLPNGW